MVIDFLSSTFDDGSAVITDFGLELGCAGVLFLGILDDGRFLLHLNDSLA